jgi:lysophospholipase L1-like esterase
MAAIQPLNLPTLIGGVTPGYPGYYTLLIAKINEVATVMSITPLNLVAALGAGTPAADFNTTVLKVNELIGSLNNGGGSTAPSATKASAPFFGVIDDVNNTVTLGSNYAFSRTRWGIEGQGPQALPANSICSPGNITGRLYAYVIADSASNELQSDTVYSQPFSPAANANVAPTATLSVMGGTSSVTTGQSVVLNLAGFDTDGTVTKVEALDNGIKIGEISGASGSLQTAGLAAGSHSFTAKAYDDKGATGLSTAALVTAQVSSGNTGQKRQLFGIGDSITAGYQLPDYTNNNWLARLGFATPDLYGQVINNAHSGYTSSQLFQSLSETTSKINTVDFAGADIFILCGVNDFRYSATVSAVQANYQKMITQLKAVAPGKVRVYLVTLTATKGYYLNVEKSAALEESVPRQINENNAGIRANAVSWGAANFVDFARIEAIQNAADPAIMFDGLHPTVATAQIMANAGESFVRAGVQPSGPILTSPAPDPGTGGGSNGYVEDPSLSVLPWTNPTLVPKDEGGYELLSADSTGSRARTLITQSNYNNVVSSSQSFVPVNGIEWIGELCFTVNSLDDIVFGYPTYRTNAWGDFRLAGFLHGDGSVNFLREGAPAQPVEGAAFNVTTQKEIIVRAYRTKVVFLVDGVKKATLNREETANFIPSVSVYRQGVIVSMKIRAYSYANVV